MHFCTVIWSSGIAVAGRPLRILLEVLSLEWRVFSDQNVQSQEKGNVLPALILLPAIVTGQGSRRTSSERVIVADVKVHGARSAALLSRIAGAPHVAVRRRRRAVVAENRVAAS